MARKSLSIALAATFLLAAWGGEAHAQVVPVDALAGAGSFDTDDWFFQGPKDATFAREACAELTGTCARIAGEDRGVRIYDTQLVYWDGESVMPRYVTLQGGKQYRIQLRASASAAGKTIEVALEDTLYRVVGSSTFTVGTTVAEHTGDPIVIAAAGGNRDVSVRINAGGSASDGVTFPLDDLVLLEEEGPPPGEEVNLLADGDMESSPTSAVWNRWANDGSNATFEITDCTATGFTGNCFRATGSNFGANPYSTQLVKWGGGADPAFFTIDQTKSYTIKFRGRAAAAGGVVQVMIQGPADAYVTPVQHDFTLTATAAEYSHGFQVAETDSLAFKMNFISPAGTDQTFEVDDLQLVESAPADP
jgi:hypothetical protein